MRLFLALEIDDEMRRRADAVRRTVQERHGAIATRGLRWVRADQLHLTLRFLGEVSDALAAQVVDACAAGVGVAPFSVECGSPAWLPHAGSPRVLMLPVVSGLERVRRLKVEVEARLPGGVPPDDARPFTPHLTLARARDDARREVRAIARDIEGEGGPSLALVIDHVALFRSELSPRGPAYHELARIAFTG